MVVFRAFFGLLLAAFATAEFLVIEPKEQVTTLNSTVTVLCKVDYTIDSCRMTVGGISYRLIPGNLDGDVIYYSKTEDGLKHGECGAIIKNIQDSWNGNVTCTVPPQTGNIELTASMKLTVARKPLKPTLVVYPDEQRPYTDGETLLAQCVVPAGRPAAKINWLLDNEQILNNLHQQQDIPRENEEWDAVQNITVKVTPDFNGKSLRCEAVHPALSQEDRWEASKQIIVNYKPTRSETGLITIFGLKLGEPGQLNVTVRANPEPKVQWTVAGENIIPLQPSNDQTMIAERPVLLDNSGHYNVTLIIDPVTKEAVEREYILKVSNNIGDDQYSVRISTMDEPAGVELSAGAIVGIVIAVLVLLAAISLAVFAKATDRWCFAGGRPREGKNSGESSDTESAGGRAGGPRGALAGLGARVRAALRANDKVAETQRDTVDKPEEKKGVVYAELALGEQAAGDKPPPPATEYAEIVYSDQQKQVKE